ncbi:MAG: hypothetical protein AAF320_06410, partial [Myxococcota bacterium]
NRLRLPPDVSPIAHAVLAACTPNPTDEPRSCLMLASPQKQLLWAVDMETGAVVPANNRFFPLTVPLKAFASRLASLPNTPFVWALDGSKGHLYAIPIQKNQAFVNQPFAFSSIEKPAVDATLFLDNTQRTTALITSPKEKQIHVLPLDINTGIANTNAGFVVNVATAPHHIATDHDSQWAVITNPASTQVQILSLANLAQNPSVQSVDVGHRTRLVTIGKAQLEPQQPPQTVAMVVGDFLKNENDSATAETHITWIPLSHSTDRSQLIKLPIQNKKKSKNENQNNMPDQDKNKTTEDKGFVQVAYMPSGNDISPCCGHTKENQEPWAAVATTNGTLIYITLNSQKQLRVTKEISLSNRNQLGDGAVNPVALVGGKLHLPQNSEPPSNMCKRQMFLVFPSLVASFCEGSSTARRL